MNFILASTSTVHGAGYLEYLRPELEELLAGVEQITFIPYARPSGLTHDEYTAVAQKFFETMGKKLMGLHKFEDTKEALQKAEAVFTGGGNTFLLVKTMYEQALFPILSSRIKSGMPYLGTSAGSNIAGQNMKTTNDMPIVFTPSFETMAIVPFNINPHYLDPDPLSTHKGETRETRILEYISQNSIPVLGIREGNWIRGLNNQLTVAGAHSSRVFMQKKTPFEIEPGTNLTELFN